MIRIRHYSEDDSPELIDLFRAFFTWHRRLLGSEELLSDTEAAGITRQALDQVSSWTLVAEEASGQIVGFARWEERDGAFFGRELFVRPGVHNQGIGARLQEEVERRVVEAGADAFFISVIPHNRRMLAFAHGHGYDTLNTVELRKELRGERPRRGRVNMFGLEWKTM